ncbi:MAG: 16S rRNA (guanine(527)-N(7))-methyltransferase RsmG [Nocardioidaceae bacterium]
MVEQLFGSATPKIYDYVDLLTSAAVARGMLGPREASRVWPRHILNCAVIAPVFPHRQPVCDIGSGAGLPGVVLAIARPDLTVTMLEPLLRRVTFLYEVVAHLGLDNAVVLRSRAEEAAGGAGYGAVTARAVAPLARLAGWAFPLLAPGGELIAIKGRSAAAELTAARPVLRRLGARRTRVESYGRGIVDPETIVVRIESGIG